MKPALLLLSLALVLPLSARAAGDNALAAALGQRLAALQANPATADQAPLERLQAQQAIDALDKARKRDLEHVAYLAGRRVEVAEAAARAACPMRRRSSGSAATWQAAAMKPASSPHSTARPCSPSRSTSRLSVSSPR